MATDRLYFRQLLSGRDFAAGDMIAQQMRNFAYLIGDRETGDTVVVDPAYAAGDLVDALEADGMRLSGVLVTHHHPDHVGGSMMGFELKGGLAELLERTSVPVHVNALEADWVSKVTGIARSELTEHTHGDVVTVGDIDIELLHTPRPHPGQPMLPARRATRRRRHPVPGGLRAHRLPPRRQRRRHVPQPAGAGQAVRRPDGVSRALVLRRAERVAVGGALHQLRLPGEQPRPVAHADGRLTSPEPVTWDKGPHTGRYCDILPFAQRLGRIRGEDRLR